MMSGILRAIASWRNTPRLCLDKPSRKHQKGFYRMSMPALFKGRLSIPVIGAPLFIISAPDLVIAQCKAGVVGSFPALNARPPALLDEWLARIKEELAAHDKANPHRLAGPV